MSMEQVIVVHKKEGAIACLASGVPEHFSMSCAGCQAYAVMDPALCVETGHYCYQFGKLVAIQMNVGTRFEAETAGWRTIKNGIVHTIVSWRKFPLTVYWTDELGKHIETFALHEFKKFKFL